LEGGVLRGYRSREYLKDAGTPERLREVRHHYETGRIAAGAFDTPLPAVFLDRDGTLNVERGWIHTPDQIELLPGAGEAVHAINESGRLAVVVTNQPVVARGECTEAQLRKVHDRMEWLLGASHAYLDGLYFCPHHPDSGYPGERRELKRRCACRKPGTALLEAAISELNIDPARSWMIGDSVCDVQAAARMDIPAALVDRNQRPELQIGHQARVQAHSILEATNRVLGSG
jgi:D,D-heptose 1,7-bisphosphate phosphatase